MRWSKKNKGLIKQVIDRYYWMLEKKSRKKEFFNGVENCPFCGEHLFASCCSNFCPNSIINKTLNICRIKYMENCVTNARYVGFKFKESLVCTTQSNIKKRLQFWEDVLALNKKEFVRKYKKC